jgi:lysophospholipase L1-like esterase
MNAKTPRMSGRGRNAEAPRRREDQSFKRVQDSVPFSASPRLGVRSLPGALGVLAFVLFVPTLAVAADAPAPFENEIRAFEQADAKSPPPQDAVLFLGSSSIRLWKTLAQDMPGMTVLNRGFGGSQISDSLRYFDRIVLPYRPKLIVFYAGDNDVAAGKSPQRVLADFKEFTRRVHDTLPGTRILFVSLRPTVARWHLQGRQWLTNRLVKDFADADPTADYVDVVPALLGPDGTPRADYLVADRLHLNADGYRAWTAVIRPAVEHAVAAEKAAPAGAAH